MGESLFDRAGAPLIVFHRRFALLLDGLGKRHQSFRRIRPPVQQDIFDQLQKILGNFLIHRQLSGVHNSHVQTGLDGVIEKCRVHRLAHAIVAAKREGNIADAAAHFRQRKMLLDPARGVEKVDRVIIVFLDAGRHREDIRIEDNVLGGKADPLREEAIGPLTDFDLALIRVGLASLIESHHYHGCPIAMNQFGLLEKLGFALFEADAIDDGLALDVLQTRLEDVPLRTIHHDGHATDIRFRRHQSQELLHGSLGVEHAFVHIDVDDLGAPLDLLPRHRERGFIIASPGSVWRRPVTR